VRVGLPVGVRVGVCVGVDVGVRVGVDVGVLVGVLVGVAVGVLVGLPATVFVGVWVGVSVGVCVGVLVGVAVGVFVGVLVGVAVGVAVGVLVGVLVELLVGVCVGVAVGVCVGVCVGVAVGVLVGVRVGVLVGVIDGVAVGFPSHVLHAGPRTAVVVQSGPALITNGVVPVGTLPTNVIVYVRQDGGMSSHSLSNPTSHLNTGGVPLKPQAGSLSSVGVGLALNTTRLAQIPPDRLRSTWLTSCGPQTQPAVTPRHTFQRNVVRSLTASYSPLAVGMPPASTRVICFPSLEHT